MEIIVGKCTCASDPPIPNGYTTWFEKNNAKQNRYILNSVIYGLRAFVVNIISIPNKRLQREIPK
jgi:hypothetical protein